MYTTFWKMEDVASKKKNISPIIMIVVALLVVISAIYLFRPQQAVKTETTPTPAPTEIVKEDPFVGTFRTNLKSASSKGRVITLETLADKTATFTQDYQNGKEPIVETGIWSSGSKGSLLVTLQARNGESLAQPTTMNFTFNTLNAGVLTLVDPEKNMWGSDGLVLQNMMAFSDRKWIWVETLMSDGAKTETDEKQSFSLHFMKDGTVSVSTDCNNASGGYLLSADTSLTFGPMAMTRKFCEGSQESVFMSQLNRIGSYLLQDGKLFLLMKFDSGTMTFEEEK